MLKPFVTILSIIIVFAASLYFASVVAANRAQEIADSITGDSLAFDARMKNLDFSLKRFDDTLAMSKSRPEFIDSVYYLSYVNTERDPHPEMRIHENTFSVDTIRRTDSSIAIELYGALSGGNPPYGTAYMRNDTLVLIYWKDQVPGPRVGSYFKWTLHYELDLERSEQPKEIVLVNLLRCQLRRGDLIVENDFSLLKNLMEYFQPAIVKARRYHPDLNCTSIGCGVQDSYRPFPDTVSLITKKDSRLVSFSYSFPQFTEEEMRTKTYRMHTGYTILRKEVEGNLMTITMSGGNQGWRYTLDGNILIEGDTIFFIQWPSKPEEQRALAIFKRELTYTIRVPQRQWYFRNINLTWYVWDNEKWYWELFPKDKN